MLAFFDVLLGCVVPVFQGGGHSFVEYCWLHCRTHLRYKGIERKGDIAAKNLYEDPHGYSDYNILQVLVETRSQAKFVPSPGKEGQLKCILEEDEVDEVKNESWTIEPEEVVSRLNHWYTFHDFTSFLNP